MYLTPLFHLPKIGTEPLANLIVYAPLFSPNLIAPPPFFLPNLISHVPINCPFVPNPQFLGGFTVIDVADEQAARLWAGKVAEACGWPQEVRRFKPKAGVFENQKGQPSFSK